LGYATDLRFSFSRNPDLDWMRGELDLNVPRAETDPPPDWLITRIIKLTGIPGSG
jgi:hypothetical protein